MFLRWFHQIKPKKFQRKLRIGWWDDDVLFPCVCVSMCVCVRVSSSRCVSDRISSWTSDVAKYGHRGESLHLAKPSAWRGGGWGQGWGDWRKVRASTGNRRWGAGGRWALPLELNVWAKYSRAWNKQEPHMVVASTIAVATSPPHLFLHRLASEAPTTRSMTILPNTSGCQQNAHNGQQDKLVHLWQSTCYIRTSPDFGIYGLCDEALPLIRVRHLSPWNNFDCESRDWEIDANRWLPCWNWVLASTAQGNFSKKVLRCQKGEQTFL